ncbi:MAG: FAD-binding oxidoreductase [Gammaproteobacteria bacterium]|nr:FAD-binding oxidoreductase [Pseudomonadales bacterium]MCP5348264.1 FAD-binding oxidoreductase [Pseudomonadales bacterium]
MEMYGWGRFPGIDTTLIEPVDRPSLATKLRSRDRNTHLIARGAGRSYGDSSLAETTIGTRFLDNFISFDRQAGVLCCDAGLTLEQVLDLTVPAGWLLPVLPGTRFVSVGGAIASDVHGKNHHLDGCFSNFVQSMSLMLASGETVQCSRDNNPELFRATCGGMGLTGIILAATLKLEPVVSAFIEQRTDFAANLDEIFALFEEHQLSKYSVAWLDCLARGAKLGRSVLFTGHNSTRGGLVNWSRRRISAPPRSPGFLVNRVSMGLFNRLYLAAQKSGRRENIQYYRDYFFPLDWIHNWNRLYGGRGFIQYQFVVPDTTARDAIGVALKEISALGKGSFLTVLKKMGAENANFLSFPMAGYTLALDFRIEDSLFPLLDRLDRIVLEAGGRLYLAKDARMSRDLFTRTYPGLADFQQVRREVDPDNLFGSLQSRRLGLSE